MYMDEAVIAGILAVGATLVFFIGIGAFIWQDAHKKKQQQHHS